MTTPAELAVIDMKVDVLAVLGTPLIGAMVEDHHGPVSQVYQPHGDFRPRSTVVELKNGDRYRVSVSVEKL